MRKAEDLAQDVFVKALAHPPDRTDHLSAWLYTITTRVVIDALRRPTRNRTTSIEAGEMDFVAPAHFDATENCVEWERLAPAERSVFQCYIAGYSCREIARNTGKNRNAVNMVVNRARAITRATIGTIQAARAGEQRPGDHGAALRDRGDTDAGALAKAGMHTHPGLDGVEN